MKKILLTIILACTVSTTVFAEDDQNFLNLASTPAKIDGTLKASLDKPFRQFALDWMQDSAIAGLNRIISGKLPIFERNSATIERKFYVRDRQGYEKIAENAVGTFKAYCEHHQGKVEMATSDIFCVNNDEPMAWMSWFYTKQTGTYANFKLDDSYMAKVTYRNKISSIMPGKQIMTSYGSALVLERGQGGLIKIQPNNGAERWITSDSIVNRDD